MEVRTPIGISSGANIARERTSAQTMTKAPIREEKITSLPCVGPATALARCGVINPANPIMPAFETRKATTREDMITTKS